MIQILVIGSEGQLGQEIQNRCASVKDSQFTFTSLETLDVTDSTKLTDTIRKQPYKYIINCTAYTAVDKAESETELAQAINADALKIIGQASASIKAKVLHVSTDYVFNGTNYKPYTEDDDTCPASVYGKTKLDGEQNLIQYNPDSIVLRTSWLYSTYGNNFVKTMIRLGQERDELNVIFDQIGTPTYAGDLADTILHIIRCDLEESIAFQPGIYHYSNEGVASWYDFTLAIHQQLGITCEISPIESKDYPTPAPRPHYSVLNKTKIKDIYQLNIPYWKDSLNKCLNQLNA
ncbi:dTDP-4-dehydrorhamnose reductase [Carboxylicivirga sediminis]|uniref:dTDP-4-dehydrorhamnose reductase n=1 Tax=Carboxylicivirga sediminis TaxID=2006564 RepID=A0A941IVR1_9BACT|nr:dTDP-4-dehydrorhamnose reductase [Carboxylicivirga sediminis]MBR8535291.1 dTDP-4-dehydrorhamnose reductase [Carboxylicivirga sediminis]